jgi:hypothetical protein
VFLDVPRDVLAYVRTVDGERSLVVLNLGDRTCPLDVASVLGRYCTPRLLASTSDAARAGPGSALVLGRTSGVIVDPGDQTWACIRA